MPYEIRRNGIHWEVRNKRTGKLRAKHTSKEKAEAQIRLLNAIEHGYRPN